MLIPELRQQVLDAALEMDRMALTRGTSGNISARDKETNLVAITPTSLPYNTLSAEDISVVDLDGNLIEGKKPSSETPMHTAVFRARPDVMAVVHTHSPLATAFSCALVEIPQMTVPLVSLGPVVVVPFEMPGSKELAEHTIRVLGTSRNAVLLQNHGVLTCGPNVAKALTSAVYVEEGAQVALAAHQLGGMNGIPADMIEKMKERRRKGAAL